MNEYNRTDYSDSSNHFINALVAWNMIHDAGVTLPANYDIPEWLVNHVAWYRANLVGSSVETKLEMLNAIKAAHEGDFVPLEMFRLAHEN